MSKKQEDSHEGREELPFHQTSAFSGGSRISQKGGCQPRRGGGAPTYYLANFSQKLHKMKKFRAGGGGVPGAPLRSTTGFSLCTSGEFFELEHQNPSQMDQIHCFTDFVNRVVARQTTDWSVANSQFSPNDWAVIEQFSSGSRNWSRGGPRNFFRGFADAAKRSRVSEQSELYNIGWGPGP